MKANRVLLALLLAAAGVVGYVLFAPRPEPGPVELEGAGEHYTVTVALDEAVTGRVEVELAVDHAPADVSVFAVMPDMGHSTPEIPAAEDESGGFTAQGELFTMSGPWEIGVRLDGPAGAEVVTVATLVEG